MHRCNWSREAGRFGWLVLFAASLTACTKWQVQTVSPQQLLATEHPGKIRVTRTDSSDVVLIKPQIVRDTLYGTATKVISGSPMTGREGVALVDVSHVSIRRSNPSGTAALIGGSAAVLAGAGLIIWSAVVNASD